MNSSLSRIAFLIPTLAQGGGERVVSVLSLHFPKDVLCSLIVFEKSISYPFSGEVISLDVPLSLNPLTRAVRFWVRLLKFRRLLSVSSFDAVISVGSAPNLMNLLVNQSKAILRADLPLSWSTPGFWGFLYRNTAKLLFPKAKLIVAVSRFIAHDLQEHYGVSPKRIAVIPNPIDGEGIRRLAQESFPADLERIFQGPVVATMGRLTHQKGQWHLLRAFRVIKNEVPDASLIILGEGELRSELEELRQELSLDTSVYLLGWQKNPFAFLGRAKLFVLPSLWEGLPDALLEAMACGLPVVSSDCRSGPREILAPSTDFRMQTGDVEEAEYGILVPPFFGEPQKGSQPLSQEETFFASSVVRILKNPGLHERFAEKSRERALSHDVKAIVPQLKFLFV